MGIYHQSDTTFGVATVSSSLVPRCFASPATQKGLIVK